MTDKEKLQELSRALMQIEYDTHPMWRQHSKDCRCFLCRIHREADDALTEAGFEVRYT